MINANKVLQDQLARGLGLDRYEEIIQGDPQSSDFQRSFNGYYRIRRNKEWQQHYYALFSKARDEHYSFGQIITELYQRTGNIEASFSSKMLATIDASKPIWDQYVLRNLGFALTAKTKEEKLQNAVRLYDSIIAWYEEYLMTDEADENIKVFDQLLPDYAWISNTKKIDCLLWSIRT